MKGNLGVKYSIFSVSCVVGAVRVHGKTPGTQQEPLEYTIEGSVAKLSFLSEGSPYCQVLYSLCRLCGRGGQGQDQGPHLDLLKQGLVTLPGSSSTSRTTT